MLCRNRVKDYSHWKAIFDSHEESQHEHGLRLVQLWRGQEDPNNVFFLFEVESLEKARQFITAPEAAKVGEEAGVIEGEIHFLKVVSE